MSEGSASQTEVIQKLESLGARFVEDNGVVQLIDLAETDITDNELPLLTQLDSLRTIILADVRVHS